MHVGESMQSPSLTAHEINGITGKIIGAAIEIHRALGPGLLESAYIACLRHELGEAGLRVEACRRLPLVYKQVRLDCVFVADLIVDDCVLVEVKSMEALAPVHFRQVTTYVRLADLRVALLINFGAMVLRDGIHRIANGFPLL
jgi:GxxExxY protein